MEEKNLQDPMNSEKNATNTATMYRSLGPTPQVKTEKENALTAPFPRKQNAYCTPHASACDFGVQQ
jgi:hypothetical protein